MRVQFDLFNRRRIPSLILCNPNGEELYALPMAKNRSLSMSLNDLSELTFELPKYENSDEITPYYDVIKTRRVIKLEDVGQFLITKVEVENDGVVEIKKVTCKGLEFELSSKNLDLLEGTYNFYDPSNPAKSLMHIIMGYLPTWSIEEVDSKLWGIWRTFDIKDNNIYNFLMGDVQEAYDCVFVFDTFKRKIKAVKTSNLPKKTDIFMSNRNLMKDLRITENADNIITALDVYGDGELSIRTVNPMGTPTIYNFSHFATTEWMSQGLIDAITKWQKKIEEAEKEYARLLTLIKNQNNKLATLQNELVNLNIEKKALEQKHSLAVVAGDNKNCEKYKGQITGKEKEIKAKEKQIKDKENEISQTNTSLSNISKSLSFENNFTVEQIKELNPFIYQSSIQNTNYAVTNLTTIEERQEMMYSLYNWGKQELNKSCQPIWEFNIDAINFLNLIEYKETSSQLELGSEVIIEVDRHKDLFATALLLGYRIDLDSFDNLELEFSSVLRFKSSSWTFEELFDSTASISKSFDFESYTWNIGKEAYSMIDEYTKHALDLTTQEITSSTNQEFTLSGVGLRGREFDPLTETYLPEQIWMNKNVLAFSDDAFKTTKTALGKITLPDGSKAYGLIGEYIVGKLLAGKTLVIENEKSTFRVDGQGVYIKDANIIMTSESGQELSIPDLIAKSTEKIDNVLTANGLLDTEKLYGQILAGTNNILCINQSKTKALLINDTGILISNKKDSGKWVWTTAISADGISANAIQANGTLSGVNIVGGSLNIGNKAFTVDGNGNVGITKGSINLGDGAFKVNSSGDITATKGSINFGDGKFTVNNLGEVVARSITLTDNVTGTVDANNLKINNLVVGGNVTMGDSATISWGQVASKPSDLAYQGDIPTDSKIRGLASTESKSLLSQTFGITSTTIGKSSISSPNITGGTITGSNLIGGTITQESTNSRYSDCQLIGGRLQFIKGGSYFGAVMGDRNDGRMWIEGMNALKLTSYNGGISLTPASGNKIYLEGDTVIYGKLMNSRGEEIGAVAKFA